MSNILSFFTRAEAGLPPEIFEKQSDTDIYNKLKTSERDILDYQIAVLKDRFKFILSSTDHIFWEIDIDNNIFYCSLKTEDYDLNRKNEFKEIFQDVEIKNFDKFRTSHQELSRELIPEDSFVNFNFEIYTKDSILKVTGKKIFSGHKLIRIVGVNKNIEKSKIVETKSMEISFSENIPVRDEIEIEIDKEVKRNKRYKNSFSIIFFEISDCIGIEDSLDKNMVEKLLSDVISEIRYLKRDTDTIGMWNKTIFIIILSETDIKGAEVFTRRLRRKIKLMSFRNDIQLTANFSITEFDPKSNRETLINNGYKTLLQANKDGRDTILIYSSKEK